MLKKRGNGSNMQSLPKLLAMFLRTMLSMKPPRSNWTFPSLIWRTMASWAVPRDIMQASWIFHQDGFPADLAWSASSRCRVSVLASAKHDSSSNSSHRAYGKHNKVDWRRYTGPIKKFYKIGRPS